MRTRALAIGLVLALTACAGTRGEPAPSVLAADQMRIAAMVAGDTVALRPLLHDDLVYTHSSGKVDTKASLLASLESGSVDYRRIETHGEIVRAQRDAGIVQTPVVFEVVAGHELHRITGSYTATYVWQDGRWQLVAYQSSSHEVQSEPLPTRP